MRRSKQEAAHTRDAIVAAAADHIRRTGIAQASLSDIMAAAGLTHGGFYRHFRNKDQLVAEALSAAGDKTAAIISRAMSKGGISSAIDSYLSISHRDAPAPICPLAALGSEMARSGSETKAAATEVLEKLVDTLARGASEPDGRATVLVDLCTMVGAMTLARVVSDAPLSDEILRRASARLRQPSSS